MYMRLLRLKIKEESIPLINDFYAGRALAELQNTLGCQFVQPVAKPSGNRKN